MPSMKLTKSAVDSARPGTTDYELRDTIVPGFLCKITPAGRKVFMLSYRTPKGERRKPSLGTYGQITVDQGRKLAQDFLASVRSGADPSQERQAARSAPTVKDLADRFMVEHSEARNKPSTVRGNRITLKVHVLPALGKIKVADVKRSDVADLVGRLRGTPTAANHCLSLLRKMFNLAELWGLRPDGTNPCRHIKKYTGSKRTRLITDEELTRLYAYLDRAEAQAADNAQSLLADPARLAAVQRGCKTNQPWANETLCREAAQAIRLRFRGQGVPYRPRAVDPFPTRPQPATPPSGNNPSPPRQPGRIL